MSSSPWVLLCAWVGRGALPRLGAALSPAGVALVFAVVQLDAVVDWGLVAARAAALPPWQSAATAVGLALLWLPGAAAALRFALYGAPTAALWRQPVGDRAWAIALAAPGLVAVSPVLAALALVGPASAVAAAPWAVGAALALCGRSWRGAAAWLGGLVGAVAVADAAPWSAVAPLVLGLAALPRAAGAVRAGLPTGGRGTRSWPWPSRGPTTALLQRDLLAIVRSAPGVLAGALFAAAPAWGAQTAVRVNNDWSGEVTARAAVLSLVVLSPVAIGGLIEVGKALGERLDPPEWPVSAAHRAATLALLAGALLAPTAAGLLAAGTGDGLRGTARLVAAWAALAGTVALTLVAPRIAERREHATSPWLLAMVTLGVVLCAPGYAGAAVGVAVAVASIGLASWRLVGHRRSLWS